ncbi:putative ankyrin repeat-containing domain superfamily [Septoria linicola]|nr:putative ankyrin repeat-containing domain superfamily [Septoria linicola]
MGAFKRYPPEIFQDIVESLVVMIGIQKAVLLRAVCREFDKAILHAICASQVVDMNDPVTPNLARRMHPRLRGKIILRKSKSASISSEPYLRVVSKICQAFERLCPGLDDQLLLSRNESVAAAVKMDGVGVIDGPIETQNLLSAACIVGDRTMLELVLRSEDCTTDVAGINGFTTYFDNCLTVAAMGGYVDLVLFLLDQGAESQQELPSWKQHSLIQTQADWAGQDHYRQRACLFKRDPSPLRAATSAGHTEIVHILLEPSTRMPENSLEYLRVALAAARAGRLDLIDAVFAAIGKCIRDFEFLENEMMWEAIRGNCLNVVEMLLDQGADPNALPYPSSRGNRGALPLAASLGRFSIIQLLIERGGDVNHYSLNDLDGSPIAGAAAHGQEEAVTLLLHHGADPESALHSAARNAQPRVIRLLLQRCPELVTRDDGRLLHIVFTLSLTVCNLTALTLLVEAGVDPNYDVGFGLPVDYAKAELPPFVLNHLISLGAQDTESEAVAAEYPYTRRDIQLSERTWEWLSRY